MADSRIHHSLAAWLGRADEYIRVCDAWIIFRKRHQFISERCHHPPPFSPPLCCTPTTSCKVTVRVPPLRRRFDEAVLFINPTAQRVPPLQQHCISFMHISHILYSENDIHFQSQILRFQKQMYIFLNIGFLLT